MTYVLLVEDNPCNQTVIEDIFEFDVPATKLVCVQSGEEALAKVSEDKPCLVLMDVGLPGIDGLETTRRLKNDAQTADVPIWALTAHAMKGDEEKALVAGCEDYITKPINTKQLTLRLCDFLQAPTPEAKPCHEC